MPNDQSKQPLPGPHHCATLGRSLVQVIFAALKEEAENNGGSLSLAQIERAESAFESEDGLMTPHYADTYNFCMGSMPSARGTSFSSIDPFLFYLRTRTDPMVSHIFAVQVSQGGTKWRSAFCRRFGNFVTEMTGSHVVDELTAIYFGLAQQKGRSLSASDIAADIKGTHALDRALHTLTRMRVRHPEIIDALRTAINEEVQTCFQDSAADGLFVTVAQIDKFLNTAPSTG